MQYCVEVDMHGVSHYEDFWSLILRAEFESR